MNGLNRRNEPFFDIKNETEFIEKINIWRNELQLPRYAVLPDGDNELFVDFENANSIKTLFSVVKKRPVFFLNEFPFEKESAIVKDLKGNVFTNEFIISFYKSIV